MIPPVRAFRRCLATVSAIIAGMAITAPSARFVRAGAEADRVSIEVDTGAPLGPMSPMWAWFGYDEPNYTYTAEWPEAALGAGGARARCRCSCARTTC